MAETSKSRSRAVAQPYLATAAVDEVEASYEIIALINAVGNLGGYFGPFIVGWIKDSTKSFEAGLYFLAACSLMAAIITFFAARAAGEAAAGRANATAPAE